MQPEPIPGMTVTLTATIAEVPYGSEVAPERRMLRVRLADGQTIETNLMNLQLPESQQQESAAPPAEPEPETPAEPSPPATPAA